MAGALWFLGDVHGDISHVNFELSRARRNGTAPQAVIFMGDLEADRPFAKVAENIATAGGGTEAWFIHGNHDSDLELFARNIFDEAGSDRNLHGRVVTIAGVRVAGLGGVFEKAIWHPEVNDGEPSWLSFEDYAAEQKIRAGRGEAVVAVGRTLKHRTSIFYDVYLELHGCPADVLVAHEAPACHPRGYGLLDDLAQSMGVSKVFHGHHHDNLDYSTTGRVEPYSVHGIGYRGIADLDGTCLRKGAYDEEREARLGPA